MKIRWSIEGSGCPFQQCGLLKGRVIEIPDDEIPSDPTQRDRLIDDYVQDEFDRSTWPSWEIE